jgi:putative glycosyltransferase (TIGR04372 family)
MKNFVNKMRGWIWWTTGTFGYDKFKGKGWFWRVRVAAKNTLAKIVYFPPALYWVVYYTFIRKGRKIIIVELFTRKFGHFFGNTENYLRENLDEKKILHVFYCQPSVDSPELLNLWRNYIRIHSYEIGTWLSFLSKKMGWEAEYVGQYTVPRNYEKWKCGPILNIPDKTVKYYRDEIRERTGCARHVTMTIRDSAYILKCQGAVHPQAWRDNFLICFEKMIKHSTSKKNAVILMNREVGHDIEMNNSRFVNYSKDKNYDLTRELSLYDSAILNVTSTTGIDSYVLFRGKTCFVTNVHLGGNFQTRGFLNKCIVQFPKLYSVVEERFVGLREHFKLLEYLESKREISIEDYYQKEFGLIFLPNSPDELLEGFKEAMLLAEGKFELNQKDQLNQEEFWSIYPQIWEYEGMLLHKSPSNAIISPYFLRKHGKWLMK